MVQEAYAQGMDRAEEDWPMLASNNCLERLNKEIKRRANVVGIFPDNAAVTRLVGAVLLEQNDEWQVSRRYLSLESLEPVLKPTATVDLMFHQAS